MALAKQLTVRQETFAKLIARGDLSATEAARQAGYRNPDTLGSRLRYNEKVQAMVQAIRSNLRSPAEAFQDHIDTLTEIREEAMATNQFWVAMRAQLEIGRAFGLIGTRARPAAARALALADLSSGRPPVVAIGSGRDRGKDRGATGPDAGSAGGGGRQAPGHHHRRCRQRLRTTLDPTPPAAADDDHSPDRQLLLAAGKAATCAVVRPSWTVPPAVAEA